jgi:hypothetical protein
MSRVREERHDSGDALRRGELRRLDHEHGLHQMRVDRNAARLHEEDVGAADRLLVPAVRLAVLERVEDDVAELESELLRDRARQVGV